MFNWFNNANSAAPAAVTNPATAAGAVTTGGTTAAPSPSTAVQYNAPTVEGAQLGSTGGANNWMNTGQMVIGGVTALGNLWNAYQQNKLAKDQFNFQKQAYQTSLADNRQTYNSALEDRIRSRYNTEGRSQAEADAYLDENRLG